MKERKLGKFAMMAFDKHLTDALDLRRLSFAKYRGRFILGIVVLAAILRLLAVHQLPVDSDESLYLKAALDYAALLRAGDLNGVIDYTGNFEHPPLVKLLYGLEGVALGPQDKPDPLLFAARGLSAVFGTLAALALAIVDSVC